MVFNPNDLSGLIGKISEMQKSLGGHGKSPEELHAEEEKRNSTKYSDSIGEDGRTLSMTYNGNGLIEHLEFGPELDTDLQSAEKYQETKDLLIDYIKILNSRLKSHLDEVDSKMEKESGGGELDIQKLAGNLMSNFGSFLKK